MVHGDGVRMPSEAELNSNSARHLQDIQLRLAEISKRLTWVAVPLWVLAFIAAAHLR